MSDKNGNSIFKEKLIEEIQQRSIIYNKSDPEHTDRTRVNAAWEEISAILECGGKIN